MYRCCVSFNMDTSDTHLTRQNRYTKNTTALRGSEMAGMDAGVCRSSLPIEGDELAVELLIFAVADGATPVYVRQCCAMVEREVAQADHLPITAT